MPNCESEKNLLHSEARSITCFDTNNNGQASKLPTNVPTSKHGRFGGWNTWYDAYTRSQNFFLVYSHKRKHDSFVVNKGTAMKTVSISAD